MINFSQQKTVFGLNVKYFSGLNLGELHNKTNSMMVNVFIGYVLKPVRLKE